MDVKDLVFKIVQGLLALFIGYYFNTMNQTQKEILETLGDIREQIAVDRKEKEYMLKSDHTQDRKLEEHEQRLDALERNKE